MSSPDETTIAIVGLLVTAITTIAAAFVGAYLAFKLERKRRQEELVDDRVAGGNRALYGLFEQWDTLEGFRREVIEPVRGNPEIWYLMQAIPSAPRRPFFDEDDVSFLLDTDAAAIFTRIMTDVRRYHLVTQMIERRSKVLTDEVFARVSQAGVKANERISDTRLEEIVGPKTVNELKTITSHIVTFVDEDLATLPAVFDDLRASLIARFPGRRFIQAELR